MSRCVLVAIAVALVACGGSSAPKPIADMATPPDFATLPPTVTTTGTACATADQIAAPTTFATTLDLHDEATVGDGTCSARFAGHSAHALPTDPTAYPLRITLPAITAVDNACGDLCNNASALFPTKFGVAFSIGDLLDIDDRVLAIRVPPPWYFVSGGVGEAAPWQCLSGYQEYEVRSCIAIDRGGFGFATNDSNAPSVDAIVELVIVPGGRTASDYIPQNCCLFQP